MVLEKNEANTVDGQSNKRSSIANGGGEETDDDNYSEETTEICWTCNKRERSGEGLFHGYGGWKKIEGTAEDEVPGELEE